MKSSTLGQVWRSILLTSLNFDQILATLTTAPAARFGLARTAGRVAVGQDADLVVLDDDPAHNVSAFFHVLLTVRQGGNIHRKPAM